MQAPGTVHLVGSIGLDTVEDVFRTVGSLLGPNLRRVPDGEVGGRKLWISWQYPLLRASTFLRPDPSGAVRPTNRFPLLMLAEGAKSEDVRFGELGYAREARASYLDFVAARDRGELPAHVRFQVSLPTPFAVVSSVVVADALPAVEAAYERAMIAEVGALCRHIPHRDLCIQWDLCNEMIIWDGQRTDAVPHADQPREELLGRMQRLCAAIPDAVEIGLHLCYGDFAGRHFVEPQDAARMVELANALAKTIEHTLAYVHMPVPVERSDDAFHRPLQNLELGRGHPAFSRAGACQRRGRRGARPHRDGEPLRPEIRHRHRMRHGAGAFGRHRAHAAQIHADVCTGS